VITGYNRFHLPKYWGTGKRASSDGTKWEMYEQNLLVLGITLMPRIKNWKDLTLYRPDPEVRYTHLDGLFTETIDWVLIETHLPDMLRVALSIKAGKITPSTILRKLGAYSRKNKLYQVFQGLGGVIRTHFLLHYLGDPELRSTI